METNFFSNRYDFVKKSLESIKNKIYKDRVKFISFGQSKRTDLDILPLLSTEQLEAIIKKEGDYNDYSQDTKKSKYRVSDKELINLVNEMENNIKDIIINKTIPESLPPELFKEPYISNAYRDWFIENYSFVTVTKSFARDLKDKVIKNGRCLEILGGSGVLSKALSEEGVDIICTDNYSWGFNGIDRPLYYRVEPLDCLDAIKKYGKDVDFIICSWIPYDDNIGYKALKLMHEVNPNCKMISINEEKFGCCADDMFFDNSIVLQQFSNRYYNGGRSDIPGNYYLDYRTWYCIHDTVSVIQYNIDNNK